MAIKLSDSFFNYKGGIIDTDLTCKKDFVIDHAVLATGFYIDGD